MQILPGLASVSFRALGPEDIVSLVAGAGLPALEWGGDIHLQPGHTALAYRLRRQCADSGIHWLTYGSYYRAGDDNTPFAAVLDTAVALGTRWIRVWAGRRDSADADAAYHAAVAADLRACAAAAAPLGIGIATEFHGGTIADNATAWQRLKAAVDHPNLRSYWQLPLDLGPEARRESFAAVAADLANLHVFYWEDGVRRPLADGRQQWRPIVGAVPPGERAAFLEFVRDDDPEQFRCDAETLKELVGFSR